MQRRLRHVVNNQRFCVLPDARVPNLASAVLAGSLHRLSNDYEEVWGYPVLIAETFTDPARHNGGCYRAANFAMLGETAGWGRGNGEYVFHGNTKQVWVRPLRRDATRLLSSPFDHPALMRGTHGGIPLIADLNVLDFDSGTGLIARLVEGLSEHRSARGIRHSVPSIVAMSTAAALTGASSFDAIAQYAAQLPPDVLAKLGCRFHPVNKVHIAPSADTIRRCLTSLNADQLDWIVGGWLADLGITTKPKAAKRSGTAKTGGANKRVTGKHNSTGDVDPDPLVGIAVDGKWLRGSGVDGTDQVKLFSGMLHHNGAVIGQTQVGDDDSTCELNAMRPLLHRLGNLNGKVITADALHCQRDHAEAIIVEHHGHYLFGLKDNQPGVLAAVEAIPATEFSAEHVTTNRGHGRIEARYTAVAPAPEGIFPHASQIVRAASREQVSVPRFGLSRAASTSRFTRNVDSGSQWAISPSSRHG